MQMSGSEPGASLHFPVEAEVPESKRHLELPERPLRGPDCWRTS
jgi:hypothetical protein